MCLLYAGVRLVKKGFRPDDEKAEERRGEKRSDMAWADMDVVVD